MIILNIYSNPYVFYIYFFLKQLESVKECITSINYGYYRRIIVINLGRYKIYLNPRGRDINDPLIRTG